MIKKRNLSAGLNVNVGLEPQASASSTSNINNSIIINKRDDGKEDIVITRDIEIEKPKDELLPDTQFLILDTFANILLNQDKALLSNLVSKNTIIIPASDLASIIKSIVQSETVEITLDEDVGCLNKSPIRRILTMKIINQNGEICTDFKQVYNKEYNELVNKYHICLKYAVNM